MSRRDFLQLIPSLGAVSLLAGGSVLGCAAKTSAVQATTARAERGPRAKIRAICFDLFTLFDPRSVVEVARTVFADEAPALCEAWRTRQFEYSWLRAAAGRYADFGTVTDEALLFAVKGKNLSITQDARRRLVGAYSELTPWPDTRARLLAWKQAGLLLAPLANYSPPMLERLLANARLSKLFTDQISTDAAATFKPDPRAYALAESRLGLRREQIAFAAFGGWDAAGAQWFGFPTFWVNRLNVPQEELVALDGTGPTLGEMAEFVAHW